MNHNIRKVLDAIQLLSEVQGCELEVCSLSHKAQAMAVEGIEEGLTGIELIDRMSDSQLEFAIYTRDERIGCVNGIMNPKVFNYLQRNRTAALHAASKRVKK